MRVLHVTTRYPPGPGGVERHVREVALRQRAEGMDAQVLTSDLFTEIPWARLPPDVARASVTADGIPIHRHRAVALSDDLHYPFLPGLYLDILRRKPDIVHVHTYGTYQGFSALAGSAISDIPFVMTAHFHPTWSIWGGAGRKRLRGFYDRFLASWVLGRAARLIVQTHEEERLLREVDPSLPPVSIVAPGYTPLPTPPEGPDLFRAAWKIPGPFVLFVGRLASNKGLDVLLTAFAAIRPKFPEVRLVLVGEDAGAGAETISLAKSLGLGESVLMTGFLKDDRLLASAYREAEMLVLPSEYEAFGLVLLEAMAQGRPVIATRVGGMPEVVAEGRNGILVPSRDPTALQAAMERLLSDRELAQRMGAYGQKETVPRYSWEGVVHSLGSIYEDVLREKEAA
ncbi:MAG: glycosyltransferase family 4 protein [Candidatus Thermoplasmatota archaeon]|jgi:glycosyltransferase involved in cell wall biosynthesis|nr:glycosyltransferase family 4 protein [Candidatus Thermoplasmatota archaeon]